jgi:DNA-binding transcriptional ArsR family regulator
MTRLREHIISESPRMVLLVGERGSGRTSLVNALSSQVSKKFVGQFWPQDEAVSSVMNEIAVHFIGHDVSPSTGQMCERLIDTLERSTGPLSLIALDYPSNAPMNDFLARMSPLLQRLKALVLVTLTPAQLASLDDEVLGVFDSPEYLDGLSGGQIQKLADNLVRRKARERWIINPDLLAAIHDQTAGNPRSVVRLCRDLVDERRGAGSEGTLERLVGWQRIVQEEDEDPTEPPLPPPLESESEPVPGTAKDGEDWDVEPDDLWEDGPEPEPEGESGEFDWEEELPEPDDIWDEGPETEPQSPPPEESQETLDSFLFTEEGTDPLVQPHHVGGLSGLADRSQRISAAMPEGPDETPITVAENRPQLTPAPLRPPLKPDPEPAFVTDAKPDTSVLPTQDQPVMAAEGALWTVDPSLGSSLPDLDVEPKPSPEPVFDIDHSPPPPAEVPDLVFEEPEPARPTPPRIPISLGPTWDADEPLDRTRAATVSDVERTVLEAAQAREVSPSDPELQALLEVGRTRLSQIFNGLRKAGLLSVRKQGRSRLFKLSRAASLELEMT